MTLYTSFHSGVPGAPFGADVGSDISNDAADMRTLFRQRWMPLHRAVATRAR